MSDNNPSLVISPPAYFFVNGSACKVLVGIDVSGTLGDKTLAAAETGMIHRVIGWKAQGNSSTPGAFGLFSGLSGSGGYIIHSYVQVPPNTNGLTDFLPPFEGGYCETAVGAALTSVVTAAPVNMTVYYITYKAQP